MSRADQTVLAPQRSRSTKVKETTPMKSSPRRRRLAALMLGGVALLALGCLPVRAEDARSPRPSSTARPSRFDDLKIAERISPASLPQQLTPAQKQEYLTSYFGSICANRRR